MIKEFIENDFPELLKLCAKKGCTEVQMSMDKLDFINETNKTSFQHALLQWAQKENLGIMITQNMITINWRKEK